MPRVKRGKIATAKRKRILKETKGYRWGRKSKERQAREALLHAWTYQFRDRRTKKRDLRRLWQAKINAAARKNGTTYSRLMYALGEKNIKLNRKMLAQLAEEEPATFREVVSRALPKSGAGGGGARKADPAEK